jgi:hypothetical protein
MTEKEQHIEEWIQKVSQKREALNGFAICPYASSSKYKIVECPVDEIIPIEGYEVIIFIVEDYLTLDTINFWVEYYNNRHPEWKFFEDCASYDTYINEIQTNNGRYNLILAQPNQKLRFFRGKLAKTDYYSLWDDDYLKEILENDYDLIEKRDSNPVKSSDFSKSGEKPCNLTETKSI